MKTCRKGWFLWGGAFWAEGVWVASVWALRPGEALRDVRSRSCARDSGRAARAWEGLELSF